MDSQDCPICLDEMNNVDMNHPLLCETKTCNYNFCQHCIESLITSSKDDFMESSDGNFHTKIYLLCPNCRFDLSRSIRDTLLLRKVDSLLYVLHHRKHYNVNGSDNGGKKVTSDDENGNDDSILTASQLRLKDAIKNHEHVQNAIEAAREREDQFFDNNNFKNLDRTSLHIHETKEDEVYAKEELTETECGEDFIEYEEYGVEVDLSVGTHDSFHMPTPPTPRHQDEDHNKQERFDSTLFSGLDYFVTQGERVYITQMLTSGDPDQLAMASQVLHTVSQLVHNKDAASSPANYISNNNDTSTNANQQRQQQRQQQQQQHHHHHHHHEQQPKQLQTPAPSGELAKPVLNSCNSIDSSVRSRSSIFTLIEENENVINVEKSIATANVTSSISDSSEAAAALNFIMDHNNHNSSSTNSNINNIRQRNNRQNNDNRRRQAEHVQFELELERSMELAKNFPLPVRMPKHVDISTLKGIALINYTWDGTVMDAYSKITIRGRTGNEKITSKKMSTRTHPGIQKVLGGNYGAIGDVQIELPDQPRILIGQVNREIGRQGVMKGDVLTHINEECILGKTVEEIKNKWPRDFFLDDNSNGSNASDSIKGQKYGNDKSPSLVSVGLVFNAERSVAEALKRRAEVMYNQ